METSAQKIKRGPYTRSRDIQISTRFDAMVAKGFTCREAAQTLGPAYALSLSGLLAAAARGRAHIKEMTACRP